MPTKSSRKNHRLDTNRLLTDNTCTCSKLKLVDRDNMDSMDSVALQTKSKCIFMQLQCMYIDASVSTHIVGVNAHYTIKRRQFVVASRGVKFPLLS